MFLYRNRKYSQSKKKSQKADRSVAFNPLPLLIVDEIGGVPEGRGG